MVTALVLLCGPGIARAEEEAAAAAASLPGFPGATITWASTADEVLAETEALGAARMELEGTADYLTDALQHAGTDEMGYTCYTTYAYYDTLAIVIRAVLADDADACYLAECDWLTGFFGEPAEGDATDFIEFNNLVSGAYSSEIPLDAAVQCAQWDLEDGTQILAVRFGGDVTGDLVMISSINPPVMDQLIADAAE